MPITRTSRWDRARRRRLFATLDEVAGNHLVVAQARADHRVDAGIGIDDDLEEGRALELHELLNRLLEVCIVVESFRELEAVGFGRLDEVLAVQRLVTAGHAAVVIELLPLAHHAVAEVVQYDDLDRQVVGRRGLELANIHANTGVAVDVDNYSIRLRELRADRGRQTKAHRAHAAGGQPESRFAVVEILRRPHLVLADAGRNDRFAFRMFVDLLDDGIGLNQLAVAIVVQAYSLFRSAISSCQAREVFAEFDALP